MTSVSSRRRQVQLRENNIRSFLISKADNSDLESNSSSNSNNSNNRGKGLSLRTKGQKSVCVRTEGDTEVVEFFDDKENVSPNIGTNESSQTVNLKPRSDTKKSSQSPPTPDDVMKKTADDVIKKTADGREKQTHDVTTTENEDSVKMTQDEIIAFLTQEDPGEKYYQILAEQRRKALADTLAQNQTLSTENAELRERNTTLQAQLDSALELVELYQKLLDNQDPPAKHSNDNSSE